MQQPNDRRDATVDSECPETECAETECAETERHGTWTIRRSSGSAIDFHQRELPELHGDAGEIWLHHTDRPTMVLGSTQPATLLDHERAHAAGWETGRRRSGGGLVVVVPGTHIWADILIGPDHPAWVDDVTEAFTWVGTAWARTITEALGPIPSRPAVHHGPLLDRDAGRLLCFAGLGNGEVTIGGSKVVGLSQRRTRSAARFQTMLELADHTPRVEPFALNDLSSFLLERRQSGPAQRQIGLPAMPVTAQPTLMNTGNSRHLLDDLDRVTQSLLANLMDPGF